MINGAWYASTLLAVIVCGYAAGMERPPQPNDAIDDLFLLARQNQIRRITEIIKKIEENARNNAGSSKTEEEISDLIGRLVNQQEPITGNTMLHYSVLHSYIVLTKLLIEKKADATIRNAKKDTALDIAVALDNVHIESLLKKPQSRKPTISAPELSIPDKFKEEIKVNQPLLTPPNSPKRDIEITDVQFLLARQKDIGTLKTIIDKLDINMQEEKTGNTMLHYAVLLADIPLTQLLLSNGADANIKNTSGHTPCAIALDCGNPQIAGMLKRYARHAASAPQLNIPDSLKDPAALTPREKPA